MKITKAQLKKLIKEELGMMSEQEMDLEGRTFNFAIYHTERDIGLLAYLVNVPPSMLDPRSIERMKEYEAKGYKGLERFLKPSAEALAKIPKYNPSVHRAYHLPDSGVGSREPVVFDGAKIVDAQG